MSNNTKPSADSTLEKAILIQEGKLSHTTLEGVLAQLCLDQAKEIEELKKEKEEALAKLTPSTDE